MLLPNNTKIDTEQLANKMEALKSRAMPAPTESASEAPIVVETREVIPPVLPAVSTPTRLAVSNQLNFSQRMQMLFASGIGLRRRIGLIPVLGGAIIWLTSIFRLNSIRQKIAQDFDAVRDDTQRLQDQVLRNQQMHAAQLVQTEARIQETTQKLQEQLSQYQARITQLENTFASNLYRTNLRHADQNSRFAKLVQEMAQLQTHTSAAPKLSSASDRIVVTQQVNQVHQAEIDVPGLDGFYLEFEDNFRGTTEDITARLQVYLPYLQQFSGDPSAVVIDVGCGRGEWLRLLAQNKIQAVGIDMNAAMVDTCLDQGLTAHCLDAIDYLRAQPQGSLAAITGFHIIEHLPFKVLLSLFDAALHALRADGLIIFETPNPENLAVGAYRFYFDPTHLNPVVPVVAQFMATQRGFAKADILRLHPFPDDCKVVEDSELAKRFNHALYGPQDFAVIAWKTNAN